MDTGRLAGAIILSVVAMLGAFVLTMAIYFVLRKRLAWQKLGVEIGVVGFAVLLSCALDFAVYYQLDGIHSLGGAVAQAFRSMFNGFGHLSFDGSADVALDAVHVGWLCAYYASCIYTALVFFGVLSSTANYEFYSAIRMSLSFKHDRDVYVFTALNNETLTLAKSMADTSAARRGKLPCIVVFAVPELKPFDRHDELCREVMANGFYYWSYSAEMRKAHSGKTHRSTSIAQWLHLDNRNYSADRRDRFCIFAFDSENYVPQEEENMAGVFEDILGRIHARRFDKLRVNYYILTKRQIKHSSYDYKLRELEYEYFLSLRDGLAGPQARAIRRHVERSLGAQCNDLDMLTTVPQELFRQYVLSSRADQNEMEGAYPQHPLKKAHRLTAKLFARRFVVNVWDEASTIAKDILDRSTDILLNKIEHGDADVRVLSLGFGATGAAATMALYSHAAYVDDKMQANHFTVDVYDVAAERIGYAFAADRPYSAVSVAKGDEIITVRTADEVYASLRKAYDALYPQGGPIPGLDDRVAKEMTLPNMIFHCEDCRKLTYLDALETDHRPDVVVIATGDDYADVVMANALIQRVLNDAMHATPARLDLFVNVWDKNNNDLLVCGGGLWDEAHSVLTFRRKGEVYMQVHIVGNNDDIYSYRTTVDVSKDAMYNHCYNQTDNDVRLDAELRPLFQRVLQDPAGDVFPDKRPVSPAHYKAMVQWMNDFVAKAAANRTAAGELANELEFYALDPWRKESNLMVRHNAAFYKRLLEHLGLSARLDASDDARCEEIVRLYAQMCYVEHTRWNRLHIAFGWVYNGDVDKRELLSQHYCILPYADIDEGTVIYDLNNVLLAWIFGDEAAAR